MVLVEDPCAVPKLVHSHWPGVSRSLGCSAVLADQAAEDLPALDPGCDIDAAAGLSRRLLPQALVRTVAVVAAPRGAALHRPRSGQGREEMSLDLMADP
jgi:hypothetical protein